MPTNRKHDGYQRGLALMVYKQFDKKSPGSGVTKKIMSNQELVKKLQQHLLENLKKKSMFIF